MIKKDKKVEETTEPKTDANTVLAEVLKCSRCNSNAATDEHTCPYAEEINNDSESLCDCCDICTHECCMDI
jgi:hypothetical protein